MPNLIASVLYQPHQVAYHVVTEGNQSSHVELFISSPLLPLRTVKRDTTDYGSLPQEDIFQWQL